MAGMLGMGMSAVAIIVGAIMKFALYVNVPGASVPKIGVILMIAGALGFVASAILFAVSRHSPDAGVTHAVRTQTTDSEGRTVTQDRFER